MDEPQGQAGLQPVPVTRKERNHVAGLAAMQMGWAGEAISPTFNKLTPRTNPRTPSGSRLVFNLREDLGWEAKVKRGGKRRWTCR